MNSDCIAPAIFYRYVGKEFACTQALCLIAFFPLSVVVETFLVYITTTLNKIIAKQVIECIYSPKEFKLNKIIIHEDEIRCCFRKIYNLSLDTNRKIVIKKNT